MLQAHTSASHKCSTSSTHTRKLWLQLQHPTRCPRTEHPRIHLPALTKAPAEPPGCPLCKAPHCPPSCAHLSFSHPARTALEWSVQVSPAPTHSNFSQASQSCQALAVYTGDIPTQSHYIKTGRDSCFA